MLYHDDETDRERELRFQPWQFAKIKGFKTSGRTHADFQLSSDAIRSIYGDNTVAGCVRRLLADVAERARCLAQGDADDAS